MDPYCKVLSEKTIIILTEDTNKYIYLFVYLFIYVFIIYFFAGALSRK